MYRMRQMCLLRLCFAIGVLSGCHRSLQLGATDSGVADAVDDTQVRPWYVRDYAYAGASTDVPVPEGVNLSGALVSRAGYRFNSEEFSLVRSSTNELRAIWRDRVYPIRVADGVASVLEPNGLVVADTPVVGLPERPDFAFRNGRGGSYGDNVSGRLNGPPWQVVRGVDNVPANITSEPAVSVSSVTNSRGESLVSYQRADPEMQNPSAVRDDGFLIMRLPASDGQGSDRPVPTLQVYGEHERLVEYGRSQMSQMLSTLVVHNDAFYRVAATLSQDGTRYVQVQQLAAIDPTSRSTPWSPPVLESLAPGNGCRQTAAAAGTDRLLIVCAAWDGTTYVRTASWSSGSWLQDWQRIRGTSSNYNVEFAAVWRSSENHFLLVSSTQYVPEWQAGGPRYRVLHVDPDSANVTVAGEGEAASVRLAEVDGTLWALGVNRAEQPIFFPLAAPETAIELRVPGTQVLFNAARLSDDAVVATWSDRQSSFVTRVDLRSSDFTMLSQTLSDRALQGQLLASPDHLLFVGYPARDGDTHLVDLDPVTLSQRQQMTLPGEVLAALPSAQGSMVISNDIDHTNLVPIPTDFAQSPEPSPLRDRYDSLFCHNNMCVRTTDDADTQVIDLATQPAVERTWQPSDITRVPVCGVPENAWSRRNAASGRCEAIASATGQGGFRLIDSNETYHCPVDPEGRIESCANYDFFAATEDYYLLLEWRLSSVRGFTYRGVLRLIERATQTELASVALMENELTWTLPVRIVHVRGGLFVLFHGNSRRLDGPQQVSAKVIFFPELERRLL